MAKHRTEKDKKIAQRIGNTIKTLRMNQKMTQDELSDITGRSNLSKIERGLSLPDLSTLMYIADKLKTTPANILSGGTAVTVDNHIFTTDIEEAITKMEIANRQIFLEFMSIAAKGFIKQ